MLSWLDQKQRQENERQKNGVWLRPSGIIKAMLTVEWNNEPRKAG